MERHQGIMAVHVGADVRSDPELDGLLVILGSPPGRGLDQGAFIRWPAGSTDERLARFVDVTRAEGGWPALVVAEGRSTPADLPTALADEGWTRLGTETVMWTRRPVAVPHLDPALRLEAVTVRSAPEHEEVERRIFGVPGSSTPGRLAGMRAGLETGTLRAFLVRSRGVPVAVARISSLEGLAALAGIGVIPERRGEGLGSFVTAVCLRAALALGRPLVWLSVEEQNAAAVRLYERLGFRPAFSWHRWLAPAPR